MLIGAASYTVKRKEGGEYVNGVWVSGKETSFVIVASIQPFSGKDLLIMPEGMRSKKPVKVFTKHILRTADIEDNPDSIMYGGKPYQLAVTQYYNVNAPLPHGCYVAYASEVE